jgi:hypothetical protein
MATATNKSYLVIGSDGAELKTVKTLAAAKKLADTEGGSVLVDGECVYRATEVRPTPITPTVEAEKVEVAEAEKAAVVEEKLAVEKYRIKTLMNIRKEPDLSGEKVGIAKQGEIVSVKKVTDDWLCLTDGTYILCGGGEFAEPAQ